jgi:hypothetical protein
VRNKIFLIVIVLIFATVMMYSPAYKMLSELGIVRREDTANYIDRQITYEGVLGGVLNAIEDAKANINDIYINYIPYYDSIVDTTQNTVDQLNKPFFSMLSNISSSIRESLKAKQEQGQGQNNNDGKDPLDSGSDVISPLNPDDSSIITNVPTIPVVPLGAKEILMKPSNHHRFYLMEAEIEPGVWVRFHDKVVEYDMAESERRMEKQLAEVNRLATANTDVNFFMYICGRLQESPMAETFFPNEICTGGLVQQFMAGLDDRIHYDYFEMNTISERLEKIYHTDHHWTPEGSREGYNDIINMIRSVEPVISEPRIPVKCVVEGLKYYGANARTTNNFTCYDPFYFYDYNLPYHTQTGGKPFANMKALYLAGLYDTAQKADHYCLFFSTGTKYVYPDNKTGRNLLIIGDSYSFALSEVIASHFDTTYNRDIRNNTPIDYNDFIEQNKITDILILQITSRLVFDVVNDSRYDLIKTP